MFCVGIIERGLGGIVDSFFCCSIIVFCEGGSFRRVLLEFFLMFIYSGFFLGKDREVVEERSRVFGVGRDLFGTFGRVYF